VCLADKADRGNQQTCCQQKPNPNDNYCLNVFYFDSSMSTDLEIIRNPGSMSNVFTIRTEWLLSTIISHWPASMVPVLHFRLEQSMPSSSTTEPTASELSRTAIKSTGKIPSRTRQYGSTRMSWLREPMGFCVSWASSLQHLRIHTRWPVSKEGLGDDLGISRKLINWFDSLLNYSPLFFFLKSYSCRTG